MQTSSLIKFCTSRGIKIATAESCTGGLISAALTDVSGSSAVFLCGFVTYSNESKTKMLGVSPELIEKHGAVSAEVAEAMAKGALERSGADIAVAVTGIAGPTGGTANKPVGLVYIAVANKNGVKAEKNIFAGNRDEIRLNAVYSALNMIELAIEN